MNTEQPYESPSGLEPKKSNTVLIVIVVLVVLTIPALCLCGGAAAWLFLAVPAERNIEIVLPDEAKAVPMTDSVPPIEPVPPIEAVPPIESAPDDEPLSGDPATTK